MRPESTTASSAPSRTPVPHEFRAALAALASAAVLQELSPDAPAWHVLPLAFAVPMGIGLLCGLVNGTLVVGLRMHPFIVTLATLSIFRGIANVSTLDLVPSIRPTRIERAPAKTHTDTIRVDLDGWIFPRSGVAFVWTLDSAIIPARSGTPR